MSNALVFTRRYLSSSSPFVLRRGIHATSISHKKHKTLPVLEDAFSDESEDLFAFPNNTSSLESTTQVNTKPTKTRLNPAERAARFSQLLGSISAALTPPPNKTKHVPQLRKSSWTNLLGLATTSTELVSLVDLLPSSYATSTLPDSFSDAFVRRCEELHSPGVALSVFGNYAKYQLPLSQTGARRLLHSLHLEHPIQDTMAAVSLFEVYDLKPAAEDLPSAALLAAACFKVAMEDNARGGDAKIVANALVPRLKDLVKKDRPTKASENFNTDERKWIRWTLKKAEIALIKGGQDTRWLQSWRARWQYEL